MPHPTLTTLFFAGTDTEVGKTYTAALVAGYARGLGKRVGVYKPVASGCRIEDGQMIADDAIRLWEAAGRPKTLEQVCPQRFHWPVAPPQAAAIDGRSVDARLLLSGADVWNDNFDLLVVEGAGGLLSPLAEDVLNIDLACQFKAARLLIVAANRLGVIHQALATCEAAIHRGLRPTGIILCDPTGRSDPSSSTNAIQIARYTDVPVLGEIGYGADETCLEFIRGVL